MQKKLFFLVWNSKSLIFKKYTGCMPVLREIQYEKKNQNDFVPNNFGMSQGKKKVAVNPYYNFLFAFWHLFLKNL